MIKSQYNLPFEREGWKERYHNALVVIGNKECVSDQNKQREEENSLLLLGCLYITISVADTKP